MSAGWLSIMVEGPTDEAVVLALLDHLSLPPPGPTYLNAKPSNLRQLDGYNVAAAHAPWLVQIDLDKDFDCAPSAAAEWLPDAAGWMCFVVTVHALEAWLLADRERCARWLGVAAANLPAEPESEPDPKRLIVDVTRSKGTAKRRQQIVPRDGSGRKVGPEFEAEVIRFARSHWRPDVARRRAPSLDRAMHRIDALWSRWSAHVGGDSSAGEPPASDTT